ncbi:MAG TPA: hypothetical protein VGP02_09535 [Mycobacteriales bacterium]|nr:hypothetical protein [Mycobacteriales bacterium]
MTYRPDRDKKDTSGEVLCPGGLPLGLRTWDALGEALTGFPRGW